MNVVAERPPNYEAIVAVFGPLPSNVVFAWGDTVYAPAGTDLEPDLLVHEETHFGQQRAFGGPVAWWSRYLSDAAFRLEQEVEAYRAQLASFPNRQQRRAQLKRICRDLSGAMYGNLVSFDEARTLLAGVPA